MLVQQAPPQPPNDYAHSPPPAKCHYHERCSTRAHAFILRCVLSAHECVRSHASIRAGMEGGGKGRGEGAFASHTERQGEGEERRTELSACVRGVECSGTGA